MSQTLNFTVIGDQSIHCAGCKQRISNALRRIPGVQTVQASADTQEVRVTIDSTQVTPQQVLANFEQLDYQVADNGGS